MPGLTARRGWRSWGGWPWAVLFVAMLPAVWHVYDFESDRDGEYPMVDRQTYSPYPPAAYRLAEPGDTLDRAALYLAAGAISVSMLGLLASRRSGRKSAGWISSLSFSAFAYWYSAAPGPSPTGWYTLGPRAILDQRTPLAVWFTLAGLLVVLVGTAVGAWWTSRARRLEGSLRAGGVPALLAVSALMVLFRVVGWPDLEPAGYWPRWGFVWGLLAFLMALLKVLPAWSMARSGRLAGVLGGAGVTVVLIVAGLAVVDFHRPIRRFKEVVPGRVYISAMPDGKGLEIAHKRHQFKTIINLFAEDTPQRSPLWPQELAFVKKTGVRYLRASADPSDGDAFLEETLAVARDPEAWPVLVHCHGCMDRTPAWLGIYRFVFEGKSLSEVFQEIERHRGYRPKASVTLLYNHALPRLAAERFAADPVSAQLKMNAHSAPDPYESELARGGGSLRGQDEAVGKPGGKRAARRESVKTVR